MDDILGLCLKTRWGDNRPQKYYLLALWCTGALDKRPQRYYLPKRQLYKMKNKWGGLINKKRFAWLEREKFKYLKNLTIEKSVMVLEALTSPETLNEFKKQSSNHIPLCLKFGLKVGKDDVTSRDI